MRIASTLCRLVVVSCTSAGASSIASSWAHAEEPEATSAAVAEAEDHEGVVAVTTRLSPDPSSIGDLLVLEVTAAFPRGYSVNLPTGVELAPLHVVSTEAGVPEPSGEAMRKTFTLHLQYFDVGEATVPAFDLTYVTPEGSIHTVRVSSHAFEVAPMLANEAAPARKPEDPPLSLTYPNETAELVIYGVLAGALLALVAYAAYRRIRARVAGAPVVPAIPPHERALARLDGLLAADLVAGGRAQDHYVSLTEIAKDYVQERFDVLALDRTTEEIRQMLVRRPDLVAPLAPERIVSFLQDCDLVKFARMLPTAEAATNAVSDVRRFVEDSMPKPALGSKAAREHPPSRVETVAGGDA